MINTSSSTEDDTCRIKALVFIQITDRSMYNCKHFHFNLNIRQGKFSDVLIYFTFRLINNINEQTRRNAVHNTRRFYNKKFALTRLCCIYLDQYPFPLNIVCTPSIILDNEKRHCSREKSRYIYIYIYVLLFFSVHLLISRCYCCSSIKNKNQAISKPYYCFLRAIKYLQKIIQISFQFDCCLITSVLY